MIDLDTDSVCGTENPSFFLSLLSLRVYILHNTSYKIVNVFFTTCYKNLMSEFFFKYYLQIL